MITIDAKELKVLAEKLKKAGPKAKKMLEIEVGAVANETLQTAKILAPVDKGELKSMMNIEEVNPLLYKIGNNADYAPFVEFGTGVKTYIPDEFKEMASQFKGATGESWEKGLEEIKAWCKRKGIDEGAAYPIFMSILKEGIHANPFLWPAFKFGRKELIERMKDYIKDFGLDE